MGGIECLMKKIKCFEFIESQYFTNKFLISPIHSNFYLTSTRGSYQIIAARVMGMSYATYLRFCRDVVGAEIIGKNEKYPIPVFEKTKEAYKFLELLNARANLILLDREQGGAAFDEKVKYLTDKNPQFVEETNNVYN